MTLTSDLLKKVLSNSTANAENLNSFMDEIQKICQIKNKKLFAKLADYLNEEYGIENEAQLKLSSIDIKNDICDFVNSQAA